MLGIRGGKDRKTLKGKLEGKISLKSKREVKQQKSTRHAKQNRGDSRNEFVVKSARRERSIAAERRSNTQTSREGRSWQGKEPGEPERDRRRNALMGRLTAKKGLLGSK